MHSKMYRLACCLLCCGRPPADENNDGSGSLRWVFNLIDLQSATNNFNYDNKIGEEQFGSVYWGQLWDRSQIAVKRLNSQENRSVNVFISRVEILGEVRHENLLSLRGYCADEQERILVYDYMPNLSVYAHLHGMHAPECLLDWRRRMSIAIGAARGLSFLHHIASPQIIHSCIKSSNILLDTDFQARIGDVGLAALFLDTRNQSKIPNDSQSGYSAPEYILHGKASTSSDVYSFGILLIELASGKRPMEKSSTGKPVPTREWVLALARENRFNVIADAKLNDKFVEDELKVMVLVGLLCSQKQPQSRPAMPEAIAMLTGKSKETGLKLESAALFGADSADRAAGFLTPDETSGHASENESGAFLGR